MRLAKAALISTLLFLPACAQQRPKTFLPGTSKVEESPYALEDATYKALESFDDYFAIHNLQSPKLVIVNSITEQVRTNCIESPDSIAYLSVTRYDGPFYCPIEHKYYLTTGFMRDFLEEHGPGSVSYVTAHEISHGLQSELGIRLPPPHHEQQADCLAGAIMGASDFTQKELTEALEAADACGGGVAHGNSKDRVKAVRKGFRHGFESCWE